MSEQWIREVRARVAPLGLRPEREAEIVDELAQHVDDHVHELISGGTSPDAAIAQALAGLDEPGVLTSRLAALEPPLVAALDEALARLTAHAVDVNRAHVLDVQADRRHGGSRRIRRAA